MASVVRDATAGDLSTILEIYNEAVSNTTATYDYEPRSLARQHEWYGAKLASRYPVLIAEVDGAVAGFGSYGAFRAWPGYRFTVEHSIYIAPASRMRGMGRALLDALIERAAAEGYHAMIAGIDAANAASIGMHASVGFEDAGILREVGWKFDRWLDLRFMQLRLADRSA